MGEVVKIEPAQQLPAVTPMQLLQIAVGQGADLDRLQKFMDMQERWEANEARKAFNNAFAAFKSEAVSIIKTTEVKDGPLKGKMHANLHDVVVAVTPALSKHGLSMSWKLSRDEKDWLEVTCNLRHVSGHAESVSMGAAPDTGPGRNAIQARASAKSYLERYTATAILGLAAKEADDDGNGGDKQAPEAPADYENWKADMTAVADEGMARLQAVWSGSAADLRRYATKVDSYWWNTTKAKAQKVAQ
jgi:hypothetical protein